MPFFPLAFAADSNSFSFSPLFLAFCSQSSLPPRHGKGVCPFGGCFCPLTRKKPQGAPPRSHGGNSIFGGRRTNLGGSIFFPLSEGVVPFLIFSWMSGSRSRMAPPPPNGELWGPRGPLGGNFPRSRPLYFGGSSVPIVSPRGLRLLPPGVLGFIPRPPLNGAERGSHGGLDFSPRPFGLVAPGKSGGLISWPLGTDRGPRPLSGFPLMGLPHPLGVRAKLSERREGGVRGLKIVEKGVNLSPGVSPSPEPSPASIDRRLLLTIMLGWASGKPGAAAGGWENIPGGCARARVGPGALPGPEGRTFPPRGPCGGGRRTRSRGGEKRGSKGGRGHPGECFPKVVLPPLAGLKPLFCFFFLSQKFFLLFFCLRFFLP